MKIRGISALLAIVSIASSLLACTPAIRDPKAVGNLKVVEADKNHMLDNPAQLLMKVEAQHEVSTDSHIELQVDVNRDAWIFVCDGERDFPVYPNNLSEELRPVRQLKVELPTGTEKRKMRLHVFGFSNPRDYRLVRFAMIQAKAKSPVGFDCWTLMNMEDAFNSEDFQYRDHWLKIR